MTPLSAGEQTSLLGYRLRSVRIGLLATAGVIVMLAVYPFVPGHGAIHPESYWLAVGAASAGGLQVAVLPWERMLRGRLGLPALYAWSATDIALIGWLVSTSGWAASPMWAVYALTTIFLTMTFPRRAQVPLTALTVGSYLLLVVLGPGAARASSLGVRAIVLLLIAVMASFLATELAKATQRHSQARADADRRAELLAEVARATTGMVTADADQVAGIAVDTLVRLGFDVSGLARLSADGESFHFSPRRGLPESAAGLVHPADTGVTALVRRCGHAVALCDYARHEGALANVVAQGVQSVIGAPVRVDGQLRAVLVAGSRRPFTPSAGEFEAVELLAANAGQALAAAGLAGALRASEARFRALTQHAADLVSVIDREQRLTFVSAAAEQILGYPADRLIGRGLGELAHPDDVAVLNRLLDEIAPGEPAVGELRIRHAGGSWRIMEAVLADLRGDPAVAGVTVTLRDVSAARAAAVEAQARAAQAGALAALGHQALRADSFAAVLARAPEAVADALGVSGAAVFVLSQDGRDLYPAGSAGLARPPATGRLTVDDLPDLASALTGSAEGGGQLLTLDLLARMAAVQPGPKPGSAPGGTATDLQAIPGPAPATPGLAPGVEVVIGGAAGAFGVLAVAGRSEPPLTSHDFDFLHAVANVIGAAAERDAAQAALAHLAMHDPLTGLPNRQLLVRRLTDALARLPRDRLVAALFIDLDRFKVVNDGLGHGVGDALLVAAGERLSVVRGSGDTVARLGGDEFVLVAESVSGAEQARAIALRTLAALSRPFDIAGRQLTLTASVGVVLGRRGDDPMRLLRDADAAMYRAKERGRDRVELFEAALHSRAVNLLETQHDLRRAVQRGEFAVVYQPEIDLASGRVRVAEALVRWDHPERGRVAPAEFVAIAEDTGLILPLGEWVLRRACLDCNRWTAALGSRAPDVAVNVSVRQISEGDLVSTAARVLAETGTPPDQLHLEITETALMAEDSVSVLHQLRDLGVHLSIDDFGTGYSSLHYLRRLPVDRLKIDRSFVSGLQDGLDDATIVEAMIGMAHALGKEAVAEGVETAAQADALRALECDLGQGYLWSRPVPPTQLAELTASTPSLPRPRAADATSGTR